MNHIKDISHKRPDLDAIFDFIKKSTLSNIDNEALKAFIALLSEQKIIVNKRSQSGMDSYRYITLNDPSTFDDQHTDLPGKKQSAFHRVTICIMFHQTKTQSVISQ